MQVFSNKSTRSKTSRNLCPLYDYRSNLANIISGKTPFVTYLFKNILNLAESEANRPSSMLLSTSAKQNLQGHINEQTPVGAPWHGMTGSFPSASRKADILQATLSATFGAPEQSMIWYGIFIHWARRQGP